MQGTAEELMTAENIFQAFGLRSTIATDSEYSCPGFRRVMQYSRPAGLMSQFDKVEYHVPENDCGTLIWSLYKDQERLVNYDSYRLPKPEGTRDFLICTHGAVDAA